MSNNNYNFQSFSSFSSNGDNKTSEGKGFYVQDMNGKRIGGDTTDIVGRWIKRN